MMNSDSLELDDGSTLHFYDQGRGLPLVLIPGWTMPAEIWLPVASLLSRKFRILTVSPPSHGHSSISRENTFEKYADALNQFLRTKKVESYVLVGWSFGVQILLHLAAVDPRRVKAAVLVDGMRIGVASEQNPQGMDRAVIENMAAKLKQDRERFTERFLARMFSQDVEPQWLAEMIELAKKTPDDIALHLLDRGLVGNSSLLKVLTKTPTLMFAQKTNESAGKWALQFLEQGELVVFEDAGHALFIDKKEHFVERVQEWLIRYELS